MNINNFTEKLLQSRDQVHIWHLQTRSYAEHKALDNYYSSILDLFDSFIEKYQGTKNIRISMGKSIIEFKDYNPILVKEHFDELRNFFTKEGRTVLTERDRDLHNIMDEMLGLVNETAYLLTLA